MFICFFKKNRKKLSETDFFGLQNSKRDENKSEKSEKKTNTTSAKKKDKWKIVKSFFKEKDILKKSRGDKFFSQENKIFEGDFFEKKFSNEKKNKKEMIKNTVFWKNWREIYF